MMIVTFVVIFVALSAWDVRHVNRLYGNIVNPAQRKAGSKVVVDERGARGIQCQHTGSR